MPQRRPLITVPMVVPRRLGSANSAAKGTICCATLDVPPTSADATTSDQASGARAAAANDSVSAAVGLKFLVTSFECFGVCRFTAAAIAVHTARKISPAKTASNLRPADANDSKPGGHSHDRAS